MSPYTLIKLSATASTNTYLKDLSRVTKLNDATVVVTSHQSKGRGQLGATWFSEDKKSLAFSIYKLYEGVEVKDSFYVSMAVAIGIAEILKEFNISGIKVKWPNDIMSRGKKCGGILIENFIQKSVVKTSIIGIGLNVNNEFFPGLPHASSMKLSSGQHYTISEILDKIICRVLKKLALVESGLYQKIHTQYHELLFMKEKIQVFEDLSKNRFNGVVKGVTSDGLLQVLLESENIQTFDLKEVKFCL